MRVTLLFILMCFLLPARGQFAYANAKQNSNHAVTHNLSKKSPVKSVSKNRESNLIDDTDFDLEEDYHSNDFQKGANINCVSAYNFPDRWHSAHTQLFIVDDYCKYFRNFPAIIGQTSPIYITQRVLRI